MLEVDEEKEHISLLKLIDTLDNCDDVQNVFMVILILTIDLSIRYNSLIRLTSFAYHRD